MLNIVALQGRLAKDPELKTTPSGTSVCSFTLAVDRSYSKDGNRQTDWIDCVAWRHTAEFICKYFSKGQQMAVVGPIQTRNYEDSNGNKRKVVEVNVTQVEFCGGKTDGGQKDVSQDPLPETPEEDWKPMSDDDLPF